MSSHRDESTSPEFRVGVAFEHIPYDGTAWRVRVERVADGQQLERDFTLKWRAMRFARSARRLREAFDRRERRLRDQTVFFEVGGS